jgi:S-adenosylmethionine:tRNA ribosyltransferase-isomerase
MHSEHILLTDEAAVQINQARAEKRRVVAVGTTSVRVLESAAARSPASGLEPFEGNTDLFITPGYRLRTVDALITNFHLPRSTLLMLVAAFTGKDLLDRAYAEAVRERYRFYSFGDAMLII